MVLLVFKKTLYNQLAILNMLARLITTFLSFDLCCSTADIVTFLVEN